MTPLYKPSVQGSVQGSVLPSNTDGTPSVLPSVLTEGRKTESTNGLPFNTNPEPWETTPTATLPQPRQQPTSAQPATCPHCHQPTLTYNLRGLTQHLNPQTLTPTQQATAILTNQTIFHIHHPRTHTPSHTHYQPAITQATHLLGHPTPCPPHSVHTRHTCPKETP